MKYKHQAKRTCETKEWFYLRKFIVFFSNFYNIIISFCWIYLSIFVKCIYDS